MSRSGIVCFLTPLLVFASVQQGAPQPTASRKAAGAAAAARADEPAALTAVPFMMTHDRDAVRQQIESLHKQDVAWRDIKWGTCLIDGLNRSRKENKPVILWIFIDRPIDDERC